MTEAEHRTVAVVDDDQAVRDSLGFLLEVIGYTVEIFASAAEFLRANVRHFYLPNPGPSHAEYDRLGIGPQTAC